MPAKQLPILVIVPVDDEGEPLAGTRKAHAELKRVMAKHRRSTHLVYTVPSRRSAYMRILGYGNAPR
jgi:predicted RNase H-like nuclease